MLKDKVAEIEQINIAVAEKPDASEQSSKPVDLDKLAKEITTRINKADAYAADALDRVKRAEDMTISAAQIVVQFREACKAQKISWVKTAEEMTGLKKSRLHELASIGDGKTTFEELRESKKAAKARFEERQKAKAESESTVERRPLTAEEQEVHKLRQQIIGFVKDCGPGEMDILKEVWNHIQDIHAS